MNFNLALKPTFLLSIAILLGLLFLSLNGQSEQITDPASTPPTRPMYFAVIGDQPYGDYDEASTAAVLDHINADSFSVFTVHLGDLKGGSERCDDILIKRRLNLLINSKTPLIYTAGDNDWVDCHRPSNGSYSPFERLTFLRQFAYANDTSLGVNPFPLTSQRTLGYPENQRWLVDKTLFLTLNVQGSNNNEDARSGELATQKSRELDQALNQANAAWVIESADIAQKEQIDQWIIMFQGNPIDGTGQKIQTKLFGEDGFQSIMSEIVKQADRVNKPLLLIHGDTHVFKFDQPNLSRYGMNPEINKKFWRLEGWGHPFVRRWIKVQIKSGLPKPFAAETIDLP